MSEEFIADLTKRAGESEAAYKNRISDKASKLTIHGLKEVLKSVYDIDQDLPRLKADIIEVVVQQSLKRHFQASRAVSNGRHPAESA